MEAYFENLSQQSGASDFLIVRDDAALTASPSRKTCCQRLSSSSVSTTPSSSSTPCMGPPSLPRRKRSADDIFAISKGSKRAGEKAAKSRVLKAFFDEVMGPVGPPSSSKTRRSEIAYIEDALKLTAVPTPTLLLPSKKGTTRWDADPCSRQHSL